MSVVSEVRSLIYCRSHAVGNPVDALEERSIHRRSRVADWRPRRFFVATCVDFCQLIDLFNVCCNRLPPGACQLRCHVSGAAGPFQAKLPPRIAADGFNKRRSSDHVGLRSTHASFQYYDEPGIIYNFVPVHYFYTMWSVQLQHRSQRKLKILYQWFSSVGECLWVINVDAHAARSRMTNAIAISGMNDTFMFGCRKTTTALHRGCFRDSFCSKNRRMRICPPLPTPSWSQNHGPEHILQIFTGPLYWQRSPWSLPSMLCTAVRRQPALVCPGRTRSC